MDRKRASLLMTLLAVGLGAALLLWLFVFSAPGGQQLPDPEADTGAAAQRTAKDKAELARLTAAAGSQPLLLPKDSEFMLLERSTPQGAPFFSFGGKYPEGWPAAIKLPPDCHLLKATSIELYDMSGPKSPHMCNATVKAVTRMSPQELHDSFLQQGAAAHWAVDADTFNPGVKIEGALPEPDSMFVQIGQWSPPPFDSEFQVGDVLDEAGTQYMPSGEYWSNRDRMSLSIMDYSGMQGWTYFELIFQRAPDHRRTDPVQAEKFRKYREGSY